MLRFIFFRLWPALIPIALYLLWLRRKKKAGATPEESLLRGRLFWAVVASILLILVGFLFYGVSLPPGQGRYVPPQYDGKILSPAHIDREESRP